MTHQKAKMESRLGCLHNQVMWLSKKGNFDGWLSIFKRHFPNNYQKRKFDRWYNQVMWPTKKQNLQGGLGAYLNRSCDLPKKEIDGLYKQVMRLTKSKKCRLVGCLGKQVMWLAKKGNFDGLYKWSCNPPKVRNCI